MNMNSEDKIIEVKHKQSRSINASLRHAKIGSGNGLYVIQRSVWLEITKVSKE